MVPSTLDSDLPTHILLSPHRLHASVSQLKGKSERALSSTFYTLAEVFQHERGIHSLLFSKASRCPLPLSIPRMRLSGKTISFHSSWLLILKLKWAGF